jgi:hypothetical protein
MMRSTLNICLGVIACIAISCSEDLAPSSLDSHPSMGAIAGNYIRQDRMLGLTDSLMLTPDGHFIRTVESATGTWGYEGSVEWKGDVLHLPRSPEIVGRGIIDPEAEGSYRMIEWGDRTYLIEDLYMLRFCNAVNAGAEPREEPEGGYFRRNGDWLESASGPPGVPAPWTEMLLGSHLQGRIEELAADGGAWVGLGASDGLRPGMLLTLHDVPESQRFIDLGAPPTRQVTIELVTIEAHRSLIRPHDPGPSAPIAIGMRITSGATDNPLAALRYNP